MFRLTGHQENQGEKKHTDVIIMTSASAILLCELQTNASSRRSCLVPCKQTAENFGELLLCR